VDTAETRRPRAPPDVGWAGQVRIDHRSLTRAGPRSLRFDRSATSPVDQVGLFTVGTIPVPFTLVGGDRPILVFRGLAGVPRPGDHSRARGRSSTTTVPRSRSSTTVPTTP
jgi:hypothetical protein